MKVYLYSVTAKSNFYDSLVSSSLAKFDTDRRFTYGFMPNNKDSLAKEYNKVIDVCLKNNTEWIIFCHDDIVIDTSDLISKLYTYDTMFDVVGVAGTSAVFKKDGIPNLWHILAKEQKYTHGAVAHFQDPKHTLNTDARFMTSFGTYPHPTILIDGVFMCIHRRAFSKIRFDESCPSRFHFYDLQYSLDCSLNRLRVGVGDIRITHASHGLRDINDEEFQLGNKWFAEKYKDLDNKVLVVK